MTDIEPSYSIDPIASKERGEIFLNNLVASSQKPLKLRINDNRSTMLSIRRNDDHTSVSLHRMFLDAPSEVMTALSRYIHGKSKKLSPTIKAYIEKKVASLDYSSQINKEGLEQRGAVHNLAAIYQSLNNEYFNGALNLQITWYGTLRRSYRRQITFGLYDEPLKLVKIHKILDHSYIPHFFVEYIVYHEMVHHVCPPYVDQKGISRIHNRAFRARERQYRYYEEAQQWIREHRENLFSGAYRKEQSRSRCYGWT
jgi:hypothetical protein